MNHKIVFFYGDSEVYDAEEPPFYNIEEHPQISYILGNYDTIRQELDDYINDRVGVPYLNPSPPTMNKPSAWRNFYFKNYMLKYNSAKRYFPRTFRLFADMPECTLAGVTTLAPGGRVLPHCGETNAVIRCHLGLRVPGKLPDLGLRVKDETICWEEGKVFAFNDAYQHEIWNDTTEPRSVLVFDLIRPEFARFRRAICAYCLGIGAMRLIFERLGVYQHTPMWLRSLVTKPLALMLWCFLVLGR